MKRKFVSVSVVLILLLTFTMVASALDEQINGITVASINLTSSFIEMKSTINSGVSASLIKNIQATGEFYRDDYLMANLGSSNTGGVSSKSVTYGASLIPQYYEVIAFGTYVTRTNPDVTYYDDDSASYYYNPSKIATTKEIEDRRKSLDLFALDMDKHIAESFDISLQDYTKFDISKDEKTKSEFQLLSIFFDIPLEIGDRKPSIYTNEEGKGVVLLQKNDGVNVVYYLELDKSEGWTVVSEDKKQGVVIKYDEYLERVDNVELKSEENMNVQLEEFREVVNNQIATSLNISLEDYKVRDIFNSEEEIKDKLTLLQLHKDLSIEKGDRKPYYFFKSDTEGLILVQKSDGTTISHFIENREEEGWKIVETKTARGDIMSLESFLNNKK